MKTGIFKILVCQTEKDGIKVKISDNNKLFLRDSVYKPTIVSNFDIWFRRETNV